MVFRVKVFLATRKFINCLFLNVMTFIMCTLMLGEKGWHKNADVAIVLLNSRRRCGCGGSSLTSAQTPFWCHDCWLWQFWCGSVQIWLAAASFSRSDFLPGLFSRWTRRQWSAWWSSTHTSCSAQWCRIAREPWRELIKWAGAPTHQTLRSRHRVALTHSFIHTHTHTVCAQRLLHCSNMHVNSS